MKEEPIALRLTTAPGVGPVTARAFVATIDDITRFRSAHEREAYLGLIPSERSSGEQRQLGHITKAGTGRMRWLAVVALARRLAGILYAMWRDGVSNDAQQIRPRPTEAPPRAA